MFKKGKKLCQKEKLLRWIFLRIKLLCWLVFFFFWFFTASWPLLHKCRGQFKNYTHYIYIYIYWEYTHTHTHTHIYIYIYIWPTDEILKGKTTPCHSRPCSTDNKEMNRHYIETCRHSQSRISLLKCRVLIPL